MKDTRELILQAALNLFLQKGFQAVTLKEIVEATGISKGAFYYYYSSKEQVYTEVINHFYQGSMTNDYPNLPQSSLRGFYNAILNKGENDAFAAPDAGADKKHNNLNNSYINLLTEGMRMLPEFKLRHLQYRTDELQTWKTVISEANANYEIRSNLTNEQVARMFICLADGIHLSLGMSDDSSQPKNQLKSLWDGLYNTMKTQNH